MEYLPTYALKKSRIQPNAGKIIPYMEHMVFSDGIMMIREMLKWLHELFSGKSRWSLPQHPSAQGQTATSMCGHAILEASENLIQWDVWHPSRPVVKHGENPAGWWFGCHFFNVPINIGNFIIPIDEVIFFRGVAQPPTSQHCSPKNRVSFWIFF